MRFPSKSMADKASANPLPPKIAALIRESWWLSMVGLAAYLALVLLTYSPADPAWSRSSGAGPVQNAGGRV
uniref:DNA translocase FtsK 4TM domain-containing protein n=1 Tax=Pelomicrobium sp. TaxID=2815319 RepID=UPI002FDDE79F